MVNQGGFIWFVDGLRNWVYPALCYGQEMERVTRVMVDQLVEQGWILGDPMATREVRVPWHYDITPAGRQAYLDQTSKQASP